MAKLTNQDYINKYKLDNVILVNNFSDENGNIIEDVVSPLKIDNRQIFSPIDFQKDSPHCAGFAAANLCESIIWKNTGKIIQLDAHQIYAKAKEIDGKTEIEGTYPECTLKAAINLNVFNGKKFEIGTLRNSKTKMTFELLKHYIHKYDFLLAGFAINKSWYDCTNDNYVIKDSKSPTIGGHAVVVCGYNKTGIIIANSWSPKWGAKGFAIISWDTFIETFMYAAFLKPAN